MTDVLVTTPAPYTPLEAVAFGAVGNMPTPVDHAHPLPVLATTLAAGSTPLAGTASGSLTAGPFTPDLTRPIVLTLSGAWTGSAQMLRSVDGGATKLPLTVGGGDWGSFSTNCNEPVWVESEAGASFYLAIAILSGTLTYRVSQ
jgi:hypothetical protein